MLGMDGRLDDVYMIITFSTRSSILRVRLNVVGVAVIMPAWLALLPWHIPTVGLIVVTFLIRLRMLLTIGPMVPRSILALKVPWPNMISIPPVTTYFLSMNVPIMLLTRCLRSYYLSGGLLITNGPLCIMR